MTIRAALLFVLPALPQEAHLDFQRDVRPILVDRCFLCHGPDAGTREADLRLDDPEEARRSGVLDLDAGGESLLHARLYSRRDSYRMPPPEAKLDLTEHERAVLARWVAEGAEYRPHWAFEPLPAAVEVPAAGEGWATSPIDRFVAARLAAEERVPSPAAPRERWLRRVTYDLTGLPPTPEDRAAFLSDDGEVAFGKVVERLLASPAFGERMAVPWLDAARYADSHGYQSDQLSTVWPWRDWVVRSLNDNLPYDSFLVQQLAGDLLPDATRDQRLATAFQRLHRMTNEGGSIEAEWRNEYVSDRVHTLGTAILGLTLECARCHDHKYDPLPQADYYGVYAYFNSIDEYGMYNDSSRIPTPSLLLPTPEEERREAELGAQVDHARARLGQVEREARTRFPSWLASRPPHPGLPGEVGRYPLDALGEGGRIENLAAPEHPGRTAAANGLVPGRFGRALGFTGDDAAELPHLVGGFQPERSFTLSFWVHLPAEAEDALLFHRSSGTDVGFHGFELSVKNRRLFLSFSRFWPGNALAVEGPDLPRDAWVHVVATYDGSFRADGAHLWVNGERVEAPVRDSLAKLPGQGGDGLSVGQRFRDWGLKNGALDEIRVFERVLAPVEIAELEGGGALAAALASGDRKALLPYYLTACDGPLAEARHALRVALRALYSHRTAYLEVPVMEELPTPRPAHVLARGAYDSPRDDSNRVGRHVPTALPLADGRMPADRLELARWLTSDDHPLTARVAVNRLWQVFFGQGLVRTPADFGLQGLPPTHPELLDWLARRFVASGWNTKQLCREIVLSATYRQDSVPADGALADDPDNALLARGPSMRLSSEMLRDTYLFAAGLLDPERGGPPVRPYQPPGLWRENNTMSPGYEQSVGTALYRRSLYSVWKRTAPLPNMIVFDSPGREVSCVRREPTNTPLQALVLLNDVQFVEAARVLAERTLAEDGSDPVSALFLRLTGRAPKEAERTVLEGLRAGERESFAAAPERADALLAVGEKPPAPDLDPVEVAALTSVAQAILNLDATVWKR